MGNGRQLLKKPSDDVSHYVNDFGSEWRSSPSSRSLSFIPSIISLFKIRQTLTQFASGATTTKCNFQKNSFVKDFRGNLRQKRLTFDAFLFDFRRISRIYIPFDSFQRALFTFFWMQLDRRERSAANHAPRSTAGLMPIAGRSVQSSRARNPTCRAFQSLSIDVAIIRPYASPNR